MSTIRQSLKRTAPQLGLMVTYPAPGIVERIGSDWDWIWIDGQHGQFGYSDLLAMVRAADLVQRPALVRVPSLNAGTIGQVLDIGAQGVIIPCVDTVAQAEAAVQATKFAPLGERSYGGRRLADRIGRGYSHTANCDTLLIVQVETPSALANSAAIAAVPGVDCIFLGPDDLLLRRGTKMDVPRTTAMLREDMEAVIRSCHQHGKLGLVPAFGDEFLELAISLGYDLIACGGDAAFLSSGSKQAVATARAIQPGRRNAVAEAAPIARSARAY
jgi:4-hydroxy-2-oxoheptanedioate aldolase